MSSLVSPEIPRKHSAALRRFEFDFSQQPEIDSGDTLSGVATVEYEVIVGEETLVLGPPVIAAARVQFDISGGTDESDYCVKCEVPTAQGRTLVGIGRLEVRDKC